MEFACRLRGRTQPLATALFNGPWGNRCLFKALSHAIQHLFRTRSEPYPVERTLLATGILEAAMTSFARGDSRSRHRIWSSVCCDRFSRVAGRRGFVEDHHAPNGTARWI